MARIRSLRTEIRSLVSQERFRLCGLVKGCCGKVSPARLPVPAASNDNGEDLQWQAGVEVDSVMGPLGLVAPGSTSALSLPPFNGRSKFTR